MEQREVDNMLLSMIQKHFPSLPLSDEHTDWGKWLGFARAVYEAGRASPASVPEGWKLVPIEATMEMCEAGWNEYDLQDHFSVRFMYERMIAAAPTSPVSENRKDAQIERLEHLTTAIDDRCGKTIEKQSAALKLARDALGKLSLYVAYNGDDWVKRNATDALAAIDALGE